MTTPRRFHVELEEAQARVNAIAEQVYARMRDEQARTRLGLGCRYLGVWRRWEWSVVDVTTDTTMASGRALTVRGMRRRRYAAYLLVLAQVAADGQTEAGEPR